MIRQSKMLTAPRLARGRRAGAPRTAYAIGALGGAICSSAIALAFLPVPFLWIGLSWAVAGLVLAALAPGALKLPLVLAACVPFSLGLSELMFPQIVQRTTLPLSFREDALLGWSLKPSQVSRATASVGDEILYDVAYSTDAHGFRVSPPDRGADVEGCLLFFSDSFTFGEGVSDRQAFPYQVGLRTDRRFRVVNLSVPGYGAEQMLAAMEQGTLATEPPCEPTHIFYAALPDHVLRAAHKTSFSDSGPRYRLARDGSPEYVGTSPEPPANAVDLESWRGWWELAKSQLRKSRIVLALKGREPQATEADIALYFAIVRKTFRLFAERWPEAELHIISWDIFDFVAKGEARFHAGLETVPAEVHLIDEILPGYTQDPARYGIDRRDLHPSASAHALVATYLSHEVLSPTRSPGPADRIDRRTASDVSLNQ